MLAVILLYRIVDEINMMGAAIHSLTTNKIYIIKIIFLEMVLTVFKYILTC